MTILDALHDAPAGLPSTSLVDVIRFRSMLHPDSPAFTFLNDGEDDAEHLSFAEFDEQCRAIGAWLQQHNAAGKTVLLLHAPGIPFLTSFFGCFYAGAIAVPAYPPRMNSRLTRLQAVAVDSEARHVLTDTASVERLRPLATQMDGLKNAQWLDSSEAVRNARELSNKWQLPAIDDDTLAFLQYTSGSTGQPKGVMLTHRNLMHNQRLVKAAFKLSEQGRVVSWLPLYHDMGLIGNIMHAIYTGSWGVLMSPIAFIQRPFRWLQAITRYRGEMSGAPSFAYELCLRKVTAEQRATLDLSSWRIAFNGAEPVRAKVVQQFIDEFGPHGFRRSSFHPCYGLAESTVITTGRPATGMPVMETISSELLEQGRAVRAVPGELNPRTFVGCGGQLGDQEVVVVDPETHKPCEPEAIGEIWVRGPSVARGYWKKPELTAETFHARLADNDEGPFLRTGDLGFMKDGELFITGRLKDLIIINGRNHYPQDIEQTIEQCSTSIRTGCVAVVSTEIDGEERLVTLQEIERTSLRTLDARAVEEAIRKVVAEQHEVEIHALLLLKPGSLPKTTSGKLQRRLYKQMFLAGEFTPLTSKPAIEVDAPVKPARNAAPEFSLLYFSSNEADFTDNKYELLIEGARFADEHDFSAVWVPERHFHAFGGLYPNPSVLGAALAMVTKRVRIRAGSVVLPLHNPVRVAEEWSVVDNLSRGRVDLAFARGWNPNDFVFAPDNYANSTEILFKEMQTVRRLWSGETVKLLNGAGKETEIRIHPLPQQRELAYWVTCSGGAERFKEAGACGANVLTALLFQSIEELEEKIVAYRAARKENGHDPAAGHVTLMMHTFIDDDMDTVRRLVREPFIEYLKTSVSLWRHGSKDLHDLNPKQQEELLAFAFERYFQKTALFGTPTTCLATVKRLQEIGVDEIACLIDFGIDTKRVLQSLEFLNKLKLDTKSEPRINADENPDLIRVIRGPEDRELQELIVQHVARSLRIDPEKVPLDKNFYSLGVSSLKAVEIIEGLSQQLGVSLSPTVLFEAPTVAELAKYFARAHVTKLKTPPACAVENTPVRDADIAVIGMGCRFPNAPDLKAFWELLRDGKNAVTDVPADHWDWRRVYDGDQNNGQKTYSRWGGFLNDIDQFDPFFFNISHREARLMDPQQRIFLEVSWEALEHAGYSIESLADRHVGVFVGSSNNGYYRQIEHSLTTADHAAGVGNQNAIIANRVSFTFNFHGPSILVDTICSASLVALHNAVQSLRSGECDVALTGGVNILLWPGYYVAMSRMKAHSPDGRCKTFDHRANGIVFGEGAGALLLKPLRQALEDGDAIYAVIKGSAVNHDGQTNGLTAPNPEAQAQLITRALQQAEVTADTISYLEAHGTGTSLGDPIEIEGASRAFRKHTDRKQFCAVGSVKTNIGHLEPAAGVCGLIKVILSMQHRQLPPTLNFEKPNPIINFEDSPFRVNTELRPWTTDGVRRAGVSSFGIGGTNAHVVVEEAPQVRPQANEQERPLHVLTLSAKSENALRNVARRYVSFLEQHPETSLANVCFTANLGRSHFAHRLAVVAESVEQLRARLQSFVAGEKSEGLVHGYAEPGKPPLVAFLFTGQGAQWSRMGHELFLTQPTFRDALERCDRGLREVLERPLLSVLYPETPDDAELIHQTGYAQPSLFALEYALLTLWQKWGVVPEAVIGHSVGEYAAACAAGVFSLEEGLRIIAGRARLMQSLPVGGGMAAVFASEPHVLDAIAACGNDVSVAAVNAPEQVVISGRHERVELVLGHFEQRGVRTQRLQVSHAFHSSLMQPILDQFEREAQQIAFQPPRVSWISGLTGSVLQNGENLNAAYWSRQLRETVRFAKGVESLAQHGCSIFVEVGPSPVLLGMAATTLKHGNVSLLPSLRSGRSDWQQLLESLSALYVAGVEINWQAFEGDYQRQRVALPTYPFERERCWIDAPQVEAFSHTEAAADLDQRFYEIQWRRKESNSRENTAEPRGSWLIFADHNGAGDALALELASRGESCFTVKPGESFSRRGTQFTIDPANEANFDRLLAECNDEQPLTGVVQLWALDNSQEVMCGGVVRLVQAIERQALALSPRIWIVTQGAQSIGSMDQLSSVSQSLMWGLGRVLSLERPQNWGGLLDLESTDDTDFIVDQILSGDQEDQVAFREGQRYVPRLVHVEPRPAVTPLKLRADASYLITGGLGSLGLRMARWMIDHGARHLVLLSRRSTRPIEIQALEASGATIRIVSADVADEARMSAVFQDLQETAPPLRGIVHAAGLQTPQSLTEMDLRQFDDVLRPKVTGAWLLHQLTASIELDFLVFFSSMSSVLGSIDLAHYAAANHFLDALAHHRRALGLPALSINWGPWAGDGMVNSVIGSWFERLGVKPLAARDALATLPSLLQSDAPQITVADIDWQTFKPIYESRRPRRLLNEIVIKQAVPLHEELPEPSSLALEIADAPEHERYKLLHEHISAEVADILGGDRSRPALKNAGFFELGMDSLMAMELKRRLENSLGCVLSPTLTFDYPNVEALVQHIVDHVLVVNEHLHSEEWLRSQTAEQVLATVEELSDEEALTLLEEKLKVLEGNM